MSQMNIVAAKIVCNGLLKGAFDVFDAMLDCTFQFDVAEPEPLSVDNLGSQLEQYPVALQAKIKGNLGVVAILFTVNEAARFSALIQELEFSGSEALTDDDRSMLKEIADPALGGGVTNLMERFGRDVEQLEDVQVIDTGAANAGALLALMGSDGGLAPFTFTNNADIQASGVAVFTQSLEAMVPEDQLTADVAPMTTEAELSPDEMNDILSGFGSEAGAPGGMPADGMPLPVPENMEMVLDIGLVATARLGRVEMPIGEILSLGPGSIIEVGHLVDEPVDLLVNGKLIARGDVVVVDEKFGLRITELVSTRARIESLR